MYTKPMSIKIRLEIILFFFFGIRSYRVRWYVKKLICHKGKTGGYPQQNTIEVITQKNAPIIKKTPNSKINGSGVIRLIRHT